ncbi:BglG family transcription antiterminator [Proteiniclasticum sp. SCR006]|uniref:BglG family transcription antiterminator n=1 Tax=Proteiniclasticum aestuarii TaxID=2817862 RepID=A0A939HBB8_9CLOT|nr:transcription antiterminator [Proteiniclasticum aestuarii]MBO1264188.1 BglG family transcription antiterminator [Proteiniclasticum aestuarii]
MYITARERLILGILLESQHLFVSLNDISTELDVSLRTVQREIKFLEDTLAESDLSLEKRINEGIRIAGSEENIEKLKEELKSYSDFELQRNERSLVIFHELLKTDTVKSGYLSSILGVSAKTLQQDLDFFEEEIRYSHLSLLRKPGYGLSLEGKEKDKRMCFVHLVLQRLEQSPIFSLKEGEFLSLDKNDRIFTILDANRLEIIERNLLDEIRKLPFRLTDLAIFELLLYLHLALTRMKRACFVEKKSSQTEGEEKSIARSLYARLSNELKMDIPECEIDFFAANLRSAKRIRSQEIDENMELSTLASELIDSVSEATGYYYNKDKKFFDALVSHLEPLLNRIHDGITVLNPIKKEIKEDYGVLYGTLERILKEKFHEAEISEDEIGFLTLHFASAVTELKEAPKVSTLVVCTSGIATSRMLTKRLLNKFPQLTIIEQGSIWDLKKMDMDEFDLIISTVGIKGADFDYIQVSPMLSEEDERKLERVVNNKLLISSKRRPKTDGMAPVREGEVNLLSLTESMEGGNKIIRDLLQSFRLLHTHAENLKALLDVAFDAMALPDDVSITVKDMLLQKALHTGSALPGTKLALVHGRSSKLAGAIFRVYRNEKPMEILGMDSNPMDVETVLLLVAPETLGEMELELLSTISIGLLEKSIVSVYEDGDENEILALLQKHLKHTYLEITNRIWR